MTDKDEGLRVAPIPQGSAEGDVLVWNAAESRWVPGDAGGGGASSTPGQAAHYIGTWDVAVAYAAGDCVRQWDGAEFKLYQAKKATTGDDPTSVVASWAEVTTPIVMWGAEDPNLTDAANPNGGGILAPFNSAYLIGDDGPPGVLIFSDFDLATVQGIGAWQPSTYHRQNTATNNITAANDISAQRQGTGTGYARTNSFATRSGGGEGEAQSINLAWVRDGAVGPAIAGAKAINELSAEAHVLPTASATRAWNDIKADLIFTDNTEGPVIHDQSDGHTYRIVSTAGVLSTVQVT